MPEVAFVMSPRQGYPLRELAATLGHELERQAVPSALHVGVFPPPRTSQVYVLLDPTDYAHLEGEAALPDDAILRRTVFLCAGRLPARVPHADLRLLRRAGSVFALDQRSIVALHRARIGARLMRAGYSASLDHFDPQALRPIDVMFLGAHALRRNMYLNHAASVLARYNCLLQIADDTPAAGDTSSYFAQGRWPLLAQAKIVVNLHAADDSRLEWQRVLDAVHAGAVVVTEHSSAISPLLPGEHLEVASPESLPYVAEALLADEPRLARLRTQAYERLRSWIPFALPVAVLRAAIVELVGEPVPFDASLGTPAISPPADGPTMSPRVEDARVGELDPEPGETGEVELIHESAAWAARRAPQVTAITVVGAESDQALSTLRSLTRSRLRDLELVVVETHSAANHRTRRVVEEWMLDHPRIAARLVRVRDAGLAQARNTALDFARGLCCLVVDAGQEVYPRCVEVLVGTLRAMPDCVFVYPIVEVTGEPQAFSVAGGDYLMSFLGWDRGRLRGGDYIHAPVLIWTDRLRQLGGFSVDPRLDGFEDYDLWCRIAERDWRGQLVAQVLARRHESGTSTTLRSIHPTCSPATAALAEHAPSLISGR